MHPRPSVAVYLASKIPAGHAFGPIAEELGAALAPRYDVVFGGRNVGCMGALANGVLNNGGTLYGVVPERLVEASPVTYECEIVPDLIGDKGHPLQRRKHSMFRRANGFVIGPGGLGTLDELAEVLVLHQLGYLTDEPMVLLNHDGFWDHLISHIRFAFQAGYLPRDPFASYLHVASDVAQCVAILEEKLASFASMDMDAV